MDKKPLICISNDSNFVATGGEKPRQIVLPIGYPSAIAAAGGIPVITGEQCPQELAELCDALVLSGGYDIEPELFGETLFNDTVQLDPVREAFELELTRAFMAKGKPILLICRGIQLINCMYGGDIWQDLPVQQGLNHSLGEEGHIVHTEEGSILRRLFGESFRVNSTHHQAIRKLAPGYRATARTDDGIIEACEHESLPIFGTQFHPERMTQGRGVPGTPDFAPYFAHFIHVVRQHCGK